MAHPWLQGAIFKTKNKFGNNHLQVPSEDFEDISDQCGPGLQALSVCPRIMTCEGRIFGRFASGLVCPSLAGIFRRNVSGARRQFHSHGAECWACSDMPQLHLLSIW